MLAIDPLIFLVVGAAATVLLARSSRPWPERGLGAVAAVASLLAIWSLVVRQLDTAVFALIAVAVSLGFLARPPGGRLE